jgi:hypothetical protein
MGKDSKNNITNFPEAVFGTWLGILFDEGGYISCGNWFYCAYFIPLCLMELSFGEIQQRAVRFASIK